MNKQRLSKTGLIIIGDEILQGRRTDTHLSFALDYFPRLGTDIAWVYFLGDAEEMLVEHLRAIRQRGDVCFTFGGIGATPDDLTRQAMAAACSVELVRHPEAVRLIENQFGAEAYPNRILMAELPEGAALIPNQYNNIPGFSVGTIHCLPGFPEMARPMLEWVVATCYDTRGAADTALESVIALGAKESELIPLLQRLVPRYPAVRFSSLPRFPQKDAWQVELGVRGTRKDVRTVIAVLHQELQDLGYEIQAGST